MSAPAVKSSLQGVGASSGAPSHSILPINTTTQKVTGTESSPVKTMMGSGLNFVTLQTSNAQPLSLVQDHRPPVHQNTSYAGSNTNLEKESEAEKTIPNGVEVTKIELEEDTHPIPKQTDSSRNNNVSPENPEDEPQDSTPMESNPSPASESPVPSEQSQNKPEEKKVTPPAAGNGNSTNNNTTNSTGNGTKEPEGRATPVLSQPKSSPHKTEDGNQTKTEAVPKLKPSIQSSKVTTESIPAQTTPVNHPKAEPKSTNVVPKATKRKSKELKDMKGISGNADGASKPKRNRVQTQPYQSPLPEIALLVKSLNKVPATKAPDDKLIVFYKNEFLAVRNAEGSFFVCQAMQNIYKSSRRIRIRWLSQDKNNGEIYSPDFYDYIDFDCILTNLNLNKTDKNKFQLTKIELLRTENILKRAIDVEAGVSEKPSVTEEHPDGLDLSLYKDESQLKRRRKNIVNKQKQARKKAAQKLSQSSGEGESNSAQGDRKMTKAKSMKKSPVNKALALAKSVAKGPNRAERAMNRNKSSTTVDDDAPAEVITPTSNNSNTSNTANAVNATKTNNNTTTTTNTNDSNKKIDVKKMMKQQAPSNNNTSGVTKTKIRGTNPPNASQSSESTSPPPSNPAGRTKRQGVGQTGIAPIPDEPTARKKPRGRA